MGLKVFQIIVMEFQGFKRVSRNLIGFQGISRAFIGFQWISGDFKRRHPGTTGISLVGILIFQGFSDSSR